MALITVAPFLLKDSKFKVGADQYEAHVSAVEFTPSTNTTTWKGLTPTAVFTFSNSATWSVTLTYAQDWTTPNSLSQYLFDNACRDVAAEFIPSATSTKIIRATLSIAPGSIGGKVDSVAEATVTLGVVGVPTFAPKTPSA